MLDYAFTAQLNELDRSWQNLNPDNLVLMGLDYFVRSLKPSLQSPKVTHENSEEAKANSKVRLLAIYYIDGFYNWIPLKLSLIL